CGFIRASLFTKTIGDGHAHGEILPAIVEAEMDSVLSPVELRDEAVSIAQTLMHDAIRSDRGMTWIMLEFNPDIERFVLEPLGPSFSSGLSGIELSFGALAKVIGDPSYRDLAVAAMQDVRADLARADSSRLAIFDSRIGLGGAFGIGGVIYVLARLSQFLGDESFLADAR